MLQLDYIRWLEAVKHMHVFVHCWFMASGYVSKGCNEGLTTAQMIQGAAAEAGQTISDDLAEACGAVDPLYEGAGDASPLFFLFHTYLVRRAPRPDRASSKPAPSAPAAN